MALTRKSLLARGAGLALGAAGAGTGTAAAADAPFDPRSWSFVRAQHPRPVREAIERHRRGLDADPYRYVHEHQAGLEAAVRDGAARYLGARTGEIALTDS